ncbi:MAG: hypothetical protein LC808_35690 [Actinobacteria bacterium]|nr:hypothetical protein [Actinomycetota bacterium]
MSTVPTDPLPDWQSERLTLLLDALDGVPISDAERVSLTWLSGWELRTAQNIAAVITRARQSGQAQTTTKAPASAPSPAGDALTSAGKGLTGLSGALADVVTAVAAMPEVLALAAREADPAT